MPATPNRKMKINSSRITDESRGSACTTKIEHDFSLFETAAYSTGAEL